ncbi:uncharacterized protein LOC144359184 [Saccoglossus kowalevskii]
MTGEIKSCVLIDGTVKQFPVARIHIDTPFFVGFVSALCMDNPVYDLILGNIPGMREPMDPDTNWEGSQRLEQVEKGKSECDSETETQTVAAVQTRSQKEWFKKPLQELKVCSQIGEVTPEMLRKKQQTDVSLAKLHQLAKAGEAKVSKNGSACRYITVKGILYREYQSPQIDLGNTFRQIVVPNDYRKYVLKVAHESILGGHLGAKKTSSKILTNFFWPGIQADVKRYCQSCDICQRTIPKGRVTKVPLGHIPIIEEPFRRVAVEFATDRGHKYILVLVDFATHYPDAKVLKTIGTEVVAEALLGMYSRIGIPREILTDQGSQFVSDVIRREVPQESTGFAPFELIFGHIVRGPMMILEEIWMVKHKTCSEHVQATEKVFKRLRSANLKCFLGYDEVEFLGHIVGHGIVKPKPDKIQAVLEAQRPSTKTQLPDLNKEFTLRTDASDTGVGAVLLQKIGGEMFPIAYARKKLNGCQTRYSVMERECLAMVWAVQKFQSYLYGKEFVVQTDHQPLTCLRKSKVANGRIMRWALALQPFRMLGPITYAEAYQPQNLVY